MVKIRNSYQSPRVALYARVSTEEQAAADRFSIPAQLQEMRDFAQEQGWREVAVFLDDTSGTRIKRPGLDDLLAMVAHGGCDVVLVHELSRLSRASVYETLDIFHYLGGHNVGFASVNDPDFDFSDPTKRFFLIIMAALNQYFVEQLRIHTRKAKRERARQGLYNYSTAPFGYQLGETPQTPPSIVPNEAEVVRDMFLKYASGLYSIERLAQTCASQGLRSRPSRDYPNGKPFTEDTLRSILRNPFYMGKIVYRRNPTRETELYQGQHEAIIAPDLWQSCKEMRRQRGSTARTRLPHRIYLLGHLGYCCTCGQKIRSQGNEELTYYREASHERGLGLCPDQRQNVRTELMDAFIHQLMQYLPMPAEWLRAVEHELAQIQHHPQYHAQRDRLEAERRRLKRMRIQGEFDHDIELYDQELERIRVELDALPTVHQLRTIQVMSQSIQDLPDTWEDAAPQDQRDLLKFMFRKVHLDFPTRRVVAVEPLGAFAPWMRKQANLLEISYGLFVPLWQEQDAKKLDLPALPPLHTVAAQAGGEIHTLPFALPGSRLGLDPGVEQALAQYQTLVGAPRHLVQLRLPDQPCYTLNAAAWPQTNLAYSTPGSIFDHPAQSIDVLSSAQWLWSQFVQDAAPYAQFDLQQVHRLLTSGGVWHLQEGLLLESPANWLFQIFPEARGWLKQQTWTAGQFVQHLQEAGFTVKQTRQLFWQPVSLQVLFQWVSRRTGLLGQLPENIYNAGRDRLMAQLDRSGGEHLLPSELVFLKAWAGKPAEALPDGR